MRFIMSISLTLYVWMLVSAQTTPQDTTAFMAASVWSDATIITPIVVTTPDLLIYTPKLQDPDMIISGKLTLPIIVDKAKATGNTKKVKASTDTDTSLLEDVPTGDVTGKDDKAVTEECYLAMIKIRNQPVHVFAVGFGADELPDFSILANPAGTNSGVSGTGNTGYNGLSTGNGMTNPYGTNQYGTQPYGSSQYSGNTYGYPASTVNPVVTNTAVVTGR